MRTTGRELILEKVVFTFLFIFTAIPSVAIATQLDPFEDGIISCEEMHSSPTLIFANEPDLGSGSGSPLTVEYDCKGGLSSLPFLKKFLLQAEAIRSEEYGNCGSLWSALHRYYSFRLLRAGLAPRFLLKDINDSDEAQKFRSYFESWAYESPTNFKQYKSFYAEYRNAHRLLTRYYKRRWRFSGNQAATAATKALSIIEDRAAGSFTGSSIYSDNTPQQVSELATLISSKESSTAQFHKLLADANEGEILEALKAALIMGRPFREVNALLSKVKNLNSGNESPLFFALHNLKYTALLLNMGADVDYSNSIGKTPLFYAVERNNLALVDMLLRKGANPNHKYRSEPDPYGCGALQHPERTPLMHAAQHSGPEMIELLLNNGAELRSTDGVGYNALDYAIQNHRSRNISLLMLLGQKPNAEH